MVSKREAELQRCLEKTLELLKDMRPYPSNKGFLKECKCMHCCDQRELNTAINRITRTLRKGELRKKEGK